MRPCRHCGTPLENRAAHCAACGRENLPNLGLRTSTASDEPADGDSKEREHRQNDREITAIVCVSVAGVIATCAIGYLTFGHWGLLGAVVLIVIASAAWGIATGT